MWQALDTSTSSEMDDPMGLQHLFEEHPAGGSTTSNSAAAAAANTQAAEPPWAEVLQLSVCCLTRWMHRSNLHLGLQAHHLDAILYLLAHTDSLPGRIASMAQAANHSADAGASSSIHGGQDSLTDSFGALRNVLVQLLQADEFSWACDHIVHRILIEPKATPVFTNASNGNGNMASVMCQAATCLMSRVQSCLARKEVCQLVMSMWVDLIGTLLSVDLTEVVLIHGKASSR